MSETVSVPPGYRFLRNINSGGFGSVVEVEENSTGEHFAVKLVRCIADEDRKRIEREVHRLRTFVHPHIVRLKEVLAMENMQAIVMELGEQSLAQVVKSHSERGVLIDRHIVYQVMVDVSSALCFMHNDAGERTAHGDVKLENILLFGDGHAKLCDLGAAESEDVSSTRGVMSMQYVSPERIEDGDGRASGSSDVWALGIVLHFLLFGKSPFRSEHAVGLIREIGSFQPTQIGTSCGEKERALLIRMLDPTSTQLKESSILRCLINTTWAGWKLSEMKSRVTEQRFGDLQDTLRASEAKVVELTTDKGTLQNRLNEEQAARLNDRNELRASEAKVAELHNQLTNEHERLKEEQIARLRDQDTLRTSEAKVAELTTDKRTLQSRLNEEQAARLNDRNALRASDAKVAELTQGMSVFQNRLKEEQVARQKDQNALRTLEAKVAELTTDKRSLQSRLNEEQAARLNDRNELRKSEERVSVLMKDIRSLTFQLQNKQTARQTDQDTLEKSETLVKDLHSQLTKTLERLKEEQIARQKDQDELQKSKATVVELTKEIRSFNFKLQSEQAARQTDQDTLRASDAKVAELTQGMSVLQNRLKEEQIARQKDQDTLRSLQALVEELLNQQKEEQTERQVEHVARITEREHELRTPQAEVRVGQVVRTRFGVSGKRYRDTRTDMERRSRFGADAIEWFSSFGWSLSGSVFTRTKGIFPTLLSFSFGKVVARFTFTFRRITDWNRIGIVTSSQTEKVKEGRYFTSMLGGAGWDVSEQNRSAHQNNTTYSERSACAAGREGHQVVLEADGRDGKRTLRLSQNGQTQPTFFSRIPVPFRFAIVLNRSEDSVSIESVDELTQPTLTGGTTEIRMDE
ncbi:putative Sucrose non-fermenting protein kinase 1 [Blattamonas nauphoetae]|uniref:Sucrose non-fermenting protein kinase 1 n=1 Tax=Blattamonas nauphoetae TaxID=2049346 RepID=A0ABQ9Y7B6_9EUKA|nr:putative Sucrose non-fermenting protein kinase 1 [Blattamonas nauphoetae]